MPTPPRVIDIHSHLYPRWYIELLKARSEVPRVSGDAGDERFVIFADEQAAGPRGGRAMTDEYWSLEGKLAFMDRHGIGQTVLSLGNPWLEPFEGESGLGAARRLNAEFAELGARTDGRILGMGVLPGGGVGPATSVVEEVARANGLVGLVSGVRICGHELDDVALEPLWEALEETRLPLLLHPHHGSAMDELGGFGHALPVALGFPMETTVALTRLLFAGVLHRHPGLRIVGSHGGGTLPYLAGRLDAGWRSDPGLADRAPTPPSEVMPRLFLDAVLYHRRALHAAADLVGASHMAFGTDHPFSIADPTANLAAIGEAFDEPDARRVLGASAAELYDLERPGRGVARR
jgi:aminocarboxymuconate-semialdehyde decarboxylase